MIEAQNKQMGKGDQTGPVVVYNSIELFLGTKIRRNNAARRIEIILVGAFVVADILHIH